MTYLLRFAVFVILLVVMTAAMTLARAESAGELPKKVTDAAFRELAEQQIERRYW